MADREGDSGAIGTITVAEPPGTEASLSSQSAEPTAGQPVAQVLQPQEKVSTFLVAECEQPAESSEPGSCADGSQQSLSGAEGCQVEQRVVVGAEFTDLANTTIIYVQPDGSLVESSGLTVEEQQAVLSQLSKQQIVQVSDTEAVQLLQHSQLVKAAPVHKTSLDPSQLQQVINQVTKSQNQDNLQQVKIQQVPTQQKQVQVPTQQKQVQVPTQQKPVQVPTQQKPVQVPTQQKQVQVPPQTLKVSPQKNASTQLKSVAQQVALQSSTVVQSEPTRIQIQVPLKQEVKTLQQKTVTISHPQVKLSAGLSNAQIIHIQPMVGQQGQQILLQQNPGEPAIQLLLQNATPVVGSLLPLVHKVTGPAAVATSSSSPGQKLSTIRVTTASTLKDLPASSCKAPPSAPAKTVSVSLVKAPHNGTEPAAGKDPVKAAPAAPQPTTLTVAPKAAPVTLASGVKERDREKEKKKAKKKRRRR
ncbi:integrator complex subunit 3 homolog [Cyprinodon tularosa]|uniref:integrator complex subunit 3 homolog n=1 Tax=Cyprinodon tularosa TaxID=77115 RepID=UPI0018E28FCE|nr:integrator complex subunit 3 homolog [Cyprinodon tularosa]